MQILLFFVGLFIRGGMLLLILYCCYCSITMVWYLMFFSSKTCSGKNVKGPRWQELYWGPRRVGHVHDCIYGHCHVAPWASDLVGWCWAERFNCKPQWTHKVFTRTRGDLKRGGRFESRQIHKDDFWERLKLMGGFEFCTYDSGKTRWW